MKKLLFIAMLAMCFVCNAQLRVKGVPIGIKYDAFKSQIVTKAGMKFNNEESFDDMNVFDGVFCNRDDCQIFALTTRSNTVWRVVVAVDESGKWNSLISSYEEMVEIYTRKYGEPTDSEYYLAYGYDGRELEALRKGKAKFNTLWQTKDGEILIKFGKSVYGDSYYVYVFYTDKKGLEEKKGDDEVKQREEEKAKHDDI